MRSNHIQKTKTRLKYIRTKRELLYIKIDKLIDKIQLIDKEENEINEFIKIHEATYNSIHHHKQK